MRLICTIPASGTEENPYEFSYFLTSQGIENECEPASSEEPPPFFNIWVYEEDSVNKAQDLYRAYHENPKDPRYRDHYESAIKAHQEKLFAAEGDDEKAAPVEKKRRILSPAPYGPLSIAIIIIVIFLFILSQTQRPSNIAPNVPGIIPAPFLSPIERNLLFDYPNYFVLRDQLLKIYTPKEIELKQTPSPDAQKLIKQIKATPTWTGFYDRFVANYLNPEIPISYDGPLFEKIGQGQIWRLFTPALLHLDLLHIFFNLLWFVLLGNQIEFRIGFFRYLILILAVGIASNTAQYLMSGPFFMGLSGVVCGMAAFIWARQQKAPWEGYLLHKMTLIFLAVFVLGMLALQSAFFFLQLSGKLNAPFPIANTAHIIGALVGYLLGRLRFFSLRIGQK